VVAVVTQPDRPAGRGRKLTPNPVKIAATARDIPVLQPTKMRSPQTREALAAQRPDLAVVAAYGRILPPALLTVPRLGCINVHASLLPRHRGASPIAHAILAGDERVGVCIMGMEEGLDTGPVFSRVEVPVGPGDTCGSLTDTLAERGAALLLDTLPGILAGSIDPVPQDDVGATYAPLLEKQDGALDFGGAAEALCRRVRAFNPWPGAFAFKGDLRVLVLDAEACDGAGDPGRVVEAGGGGVVVACGAGALRLLEVKPAGKKQMPAASWAAGRGIGVGDILAPQQA
jgi:methionyl-tRNA formyltransferase